MPDIAVLIPHYNNIEGLYKSLFSISIIEPVDVVIVDDGSSIKPDKDFLRKNFPDLSNVIVLNLDRNRGIEHALNAGLQWIVEANRYQFIARLDCSDLCAPERFRVQKEYLKENPDIHLVGSWVQWVDLNYDFLGQKKLPLTHDRIKYLHYYQVAFIHPSVMFRVGALLKTGLYPLNYPFLEDTVFFHNFILNFKTANIPLALVQCVINPTGISQGNYRKQKYARMRFAFDTFSLRYFFPWIMGLSKNMVCYILGPKIPTRIALLLGW